MTTPHWRVRPHDPGRVERLAKGANLHPLVARLLINRGIDDPAAARIHLDAKRQSLHDPELLPGVVEAAERLRKAVDAGRKIVIYGDYDVDGVCGVSLLWGCLKLAGARNVKAYIPHRVEEGYGVNAEALRKLGSEDGAELIVTVDCGITAVEEARLAREMGVELIVTDHHAIGPDLPDADVLVHPRLNGGSYPFPELCGCGVAFKLAWQFCKSFGDGKRASPQMRDFLLEALNLVALATVADVVPLEGENRIFVRHGLRGLVGEPSVGLKALLEVSGHLGRDRLNAGAIGFGLAPRINAAGRMERAMAAVEMLTTTDPDRARDLARTLDECNVRRQETERMMVAEAHEMIREAGGSTDRGALVVGREGWHPGVIGIVAGRLAETYHRPSVVLAVNEPVAQGSARSIPGLNLVEAIRACADGLLLGFGGHAAAAGVKLAPARWKEFAERFDAHCKGVLTVEQLRRELLIDAETRLAELTLKACEAIDELEPFGIGNPRPVLAADRVRVAAEPRVMGDGRNHIKLRLAQGDAVVEAVGWRMAGRLKELGAGTLCSVAFHPSVNEWNGRRSVQLELKDIQVHCDRGEDHGPES